MIPKCVAVLALTAALFTGDKVVAATHPLGVEDMLAMERIERFEIGAGGNLILFEKHGPKEGFSDYGIDDPSAASRIYVYERKTGTTRRLLENFAFPNWIGALSPDGGKIAIYWLENDRVHAGIVDLAGGALLRLSLMPVYDFQLSAPIWISNDALVYSVDPDGQYSTRVDFRRRAAALERAGQDRTWNGGSAAVVLENHVAGYVPGWRAGSLVRVDAKTGKTDTLAQGHFVEMVLSPDGRYLALARQGHYLPFAADSGRQVFDPHRLEPFVLDLKHPGIPVAMCDKCQLGGVGDFGWSPSDYRVSFFARFGSEPWEGARFRIYDVDTKKLTEIRHVGLDLASQREVNGGLSAPVTAIPFADGALVPARRQTDPKAAPIFTTKEPVSAPRVGLVRNDYKATLGRLDWYFVKPDGTSRVLTASLGDVQPSAMATDTTSLYFMGGNSVSRLTFNGVAENVAPLSGTGMAYKLDGSVDTGGRAIAVSVDAQGSRHLQFFDGRHQTADVDAGAIGFPLTVDAVSGTAVFENASATGSVFTLVDRDGHILPIVRINEQLADVAPAKAVVLKYTLPSGEAVQGCVLLPANAPLGKPLPTIVSVYPTESNCRGLWRMGIPSTYDDEIFSGMGYAVLRPSTPARLLKDGDNPTAHWGSLVEAAVNAAAAQGYVDKNRLGLWGDEPWRAQWLVDSLADVDIQSRYRRQRRGRLLQPLCSAGSDTRHAVG